MKDKEILQLINKSRESLEAAKSLLKNVYADFSASRSYYAMFYAAEAALLNNGLSFSKHAAVISAFGKQFVKTDVFPARLHRYILDAFDLRQTGDYGQIGSINKGEANAVIKQAQRSDHSISFF